MRDEGVSKCFLNSITNYHKWWSRQVSICSCEMATRQGPNSGTDQWFPTRAPQDSETLTPERLVRGTGLFSLRLSSKKKVTAANTRVIWWEWIIIIPILFIRLAKKYVFLVCHRILVIRLHEPWDKKGRLKTAAVDHSAALAFLGFSVATGGERMSGWNCRSPRASCQ